MLIIMGVFFGSIFLYKILFGTIIGYLMGGKKNIVTVSAIKVGYSAWQPQLKASGSLRAIRGVDVTTELAAMVKTIYFIPGASVNAGTVLVQLNADSDIALLHSLQASAELAKITYLRDKAQYLAQAVSKQIIDNDAGNLKSLQAQVAQQEATIAKKTIVAPFAGKLGISYVNPGQYLNPGDKVVTLQTLDPIYVDFYMPQQTLAKLNINQTVTVTSDTFPGKIYSGKITTINPLVDSKTRNVEVEATIANPKFELKPGMFASVTITTGAQQNHLTLPQTAITYNPYGDIVYIIEQKGKDWKGHPILIANQRFVTTGELRGDQIAILKGLQAGMSVVTSGQLKLKNGTQIAINNSVVPENKPVTSLPDE